MPRALRKPQHFQDIMFVTHDRNSHLSYDQLRHSTGGVIYHGHGKKTPNYQRRCYH